MVVIAYLFVVVLIQSQKLFKTIGDYHKTINCVFVEVDKKSLQVEIDKNQGTIVTNVRLDETSYNSLILGK